VRFLPDKSKYEITLIDPKGKKAVYEGELKKPRSSSNARTPTTTDTEQLKLNIAGGGDRLI